MGQERVNYSCGHSGYVNLYGPHKDRDRKVAWLEREGLCPDCYKRQQAAKRVSAPTPKGNALILVRLCREQAVSLKLTEAGIKTLDDLEAWLHEPSCEFTDLAFLGAAPVKADLSMLQSLLLAHKAQTPQQAAPVAPATPVVSVALTEPQKPKYYPQGAWNGKFYGSARSGYSYYSGGKKILVLESTKIACEQYQQDMAEYRQAQADIAAGKTDTAAVKRFTVQSEPVVEQEATVQPEPTVEPEPAVSVAPKGLHDKPLIVVKPPVVVEAKKQKRTRQQLTELRREVCRRAWELIRQGKNRSEAFRTAWDLAR
jgi:hypothetical protein